MSESQPNLFTTNIPGSCFTHGTVQAVINGLDLEFPPDIYLVCQYILSQFVWMVGEVA